MPHRVRQTALASAAGTNPLNGLMYLMDSLHYYYGHGGNVANIAKANNRLTNFTDLAQHNTGSSSPSASGFTNDLQYYNPGNATALSTQRMSYDPTGNLTADGSNGLTAIAWNHWGKATEIVKDDGSRLRFVYDPLGNRWSKTVVRKNGTTVYDSLYLREYMIRDAGGNELALYRHRQQYNEQKVAGDIFTPNNTPVPIGDVGGVVVSDGGFSSALAGRSATIAPAFTQARLSAGSGFGVSAYFDGDGALRQHLIAGGGPNLLGSLLSGTSGAPCKAGLWAIVSMSRHCSVPCWERWLPAIARLQRSWRLLL